MVVALRFVRACVCVCVCPTRPAVAAIDKRRLVSLRNEVVAFRSLVATMQGLQKGAKELVKSMHGVRGLPADRSQWHVDWENLFTVEEGVVRVLRETIAAAMALYAPIRLVWSPKQRAPSHVDISVPSVTQKRLQDAQERSVSTPAQ